MDRNTGMRGTGPEGAAGLSLAEAERRPLRYYFEDGIGELLAGVLLAIMGLYFAVPALLPLPAPWDMVHSFLMPVLLLIGMALIRIVSRRLKEQYVYARTGYVEYRRRSPRRRLAAGVVGGLAAAVFGFLLAGPPSLDVALAAVQGSLMGGLLLYYGLMFGVRRLVALGAAVAVLGVVLTSRRIPSLEAMPVLFVCAGLGVALGGALTLAHYLRRESAAGEDTDV